MLASPPASARREPDRVASASAPWSRWLLIVRRDQPALHSSLQALLGDIRRVEVIFDRRTGDRRQTPSPVAGERRGRARRQAPRPAERHHWSTFGYRLVALPAPLEEARSSDV